MTKDCIIDLWKKVGWTNAEEYHVHLFKETEIQDEYMENTLSPDRINVKEFWRAADEVFLTDTVANSINNLGNTFSQKEANFYNHLIPLFLGMYGGMEFAIFNVKQKFKRTAIAEIGCGYGSFEEHFINVRQDIQAYIGFDVVARTPNAVEVESIDGTFSQEQIDKYKDNFNIFYSCNVFQHLSEKQITKYLTQIHHMLPYGGYFVFSYVSKPEKGYTYHYGQKIQIMDTEYLTNKIKETGFSIWFNYSQHTESNPCGLCPIGFALQKY